MKNKVLFGMRILLDFLFLRRLLLRFITYYHEKIFLSVEEKGYLYENGWPVSIKKQQCINKHNEPIPWFSYDFIHFLSPRLKQNFEVFEFGCGNSSFYFSSFCKSVISVEHDEKWYRKINTTKNKNMELIYAPLVYDGDYCRSTKILDRKFHIILIDGRDRVNCLMHSVESLYDDGVVILDDCKRGNYVEAINFMLSKGFKQLTFCGVAPMESVSHCSSLFYRNKNCLLL